MLDSMAGLRDSVDHSGRAVGVTSGCPAQGNVGEGSSLWGALRAEGSCPTEQHAAASVVLLELVDHGLLLDGLVRVALELVQAGPLRVLHQMVGGDLELLEGHGDLVVLGLIAGRVFGTACAGRSCKRERGRWLHARPKEREVGLRVSRRPLAHLDAGLRVPWNLLAVGEVEARDAHVQPRLAEGLVLGPGDVALVLRVVATE
mmetsp:Transcript_10974/g.30605  ORF Transcript_10974/g.30605 Transcript_10974/m.30605 type:complete len:203 (+) Transcript_10974:45-653(+)